jgi:pimeloyl-ACP methyl ester carboxylesterase
MTEQTLPPVRATGYWPTPAGSWAYDTWGTNGRPVVLLPAILFGRHCWWPVAADLRPHATVIAVDLPGHGGSARRHRYDPDTLIDDLAALIAHQAIGQAPVVVAHASSAGLAALFATRYATHAVVTVDAEREAPTDYRDYLRHLRPDAVPHRYQPLATPADDPDLLRDYTDCLHAWPAPDTAAAACHWRVAVHSQPPPGPSPRQGSGWRHEVYDVPGRFAPLTAVERSTADIRTLLQPRDPSAPHRHEGER